MSITLSEVQTEVLQRLGDTAGAIWNGAEIASYVQHGYDELALQSGCLFAMALFPDQPLAWNYTADFEAEFILQNSGWELNGQAKFTATWERDYIDNAPGPGNHNHTWEFADGYLSDPALIPALIDLPDDLYEVERATWNTKKAEPLRSRELERSDSRYELNTGAVEGYLQDKDGVRKLRKWRVPSSPYEPYEFDSSSDDGFGIIRFMGEINDQDTVYGDFGDLCSVPNIEILEDFGLIGPVYKEESNLRIEYNRRGLDVNNVQGFELPDHYVKYVRWYALWQALRREGDGQDLELADHFKGRWQAGVNRLKRRRDLLQKQRKFITGGRPSRGPAPPKPKLPWQYGRVMR